MSQICEETWRLEYRSRQSSPGGECAGQERDTHTHTHTHTRTHTKSDRDTQKQREKRGREGRRREEMAAWALLPIHFDLGPLLFHQ
jgi:hypothetical protein